MKKDHITFEKQIAHFAKTNGLWSKGDRILVACSGGPDSLALLYTLAHLANAKTGRESEPCLQIGVYCLDHQFRLEAAEEFAFVETQAKLLNVPFYGEHIDVKAYAKAHGISDETAGREVRYQRLQDIALQEGYTHVAVAHHKDDQAESILAHIIRGAGAIGLQGMAWKRPLLQRCGEECLGTPQLIRPFLGVAKTDIYEYLTFLNLQGVEDNSNSDDTYTRNKIRMHVLPKLKEINPNIVDALCKLSTAVATDNAYLMRDAMQLKRELLLSVERMAETDIYIYNRKMARKAHESILIRFWQLVFSEIDPADKLLNASQYKQLVDVVKSGEPKEFTFKKVQVVAQYDKIKVVIFHG